MTFFFYTLLCFLYIYGPVFNKIGSWADSIFILSFILFIKEFILKRNWIPSYSIVFLILFPVFFYATFLITVFPDVRASDYVQVILKPLRIIITLLGGFSIVLTLFKRYGDDFFKKMVEMAFISVTIHSCIMILQFYYPGFRDFIYSFTTTGEYRSFEAYHYRMGGLSGGTGGAVLSVVQSMGVIILPFVLKNSSGKKSFIYILLGLLIAYSIMICGRSGILAIILFLPLSYLLVNGNLKMITLFRIIAVVCILFFLLSVLVNLTIKANNDNPLKYAFERTLRTLINYEKTGNIKDETLQILKRQILLPDKLSIFIFGNGEYIVDRGFDRTLDSDIGYLVNLWGFGIFVFLLYVFPLVLYAYISFIYRKAYLSASLLFLVSAIMLFFHAKELFLYVRMLFSIYSLAIACFFIQNGTYRFRKPVYNKLK